MVKQDIVPKKKFILVCMAGYRVTHSVVCKELSWYAKIKMIEHNL